MSRSFVAGERPALLAVVVAISYLCVPETDHLSAIGLIGVGLALVERLLGWDTPTWLIASVAALVAATCWIGAVDRGSARVGAAVAWSPAVVAYLFVLADRSRIARWVATVIAVVAAAVVARTGALEPEIGPAIRASLVALGASAAVVGVIAAVDVRLRRAP